MKRILFYDDGCGFGGHSISAVDAVKYLLENTALEVFFIYFQGNQRLEERLDLLARSFTFLKLYPQVFQEAKLRNIGALLEFPIVTQIAHTISTINPDLVIVIQGTIELSSLGLLAAKKAKYKTISFIPLTQSASLMQSQFSRIRDLINLYFYRLPDGFITTSNRAKSNLIKHRVRSKISVAYYGPDLKIWQRQDRTKARQKYHIDNSDYVVALIARIQFNHKGHDFLITSMAKHTNQLENIKVLIVGDGSDESELRKLIETYNLTERVKMIPWGSDLSSIYSAVDMLIIPSRFEGLPLVMLEAMYYSLPIVASNTDGMLEVLPQEWLFPFGDSDAAIETLLRVKNSDNTKYLLQHKQRIITEFNLDEFGKQFHKAICAV
jgi:glycosyltransferase involved in cell wall biosynthesis